MTEAPDPPVLSVVIPCLDVEETLAAQLDALADQEVEVPWEVIVVDNGSTDRTVEVARSFDELLPALEIVREPRRGRHHACNAGAETARGELLVFVDGDDRVAPGFLQAMARALRSEPVAAGRLEHHHLNPGADGTLGQVQTTDLRRDTHFLPAASGGALGVRREAFAAVDGFADDAGHAEDVDLSWRLQLAGFPVTFVPDAVVSVRQRPEPGLMYRQHRNFGEAHARLYRKYRRRGMTRRSLRAALVDWRTILLGAFLARAPDERARWTRRLGRAVGRLRGSIKYRVFYP